MLPSITVRLIACGFNGFWTTELYGTEEYSTSGFEYIYVLIGTFIAGCWFWSFHEFKVRKIWNVHRVILK